MSSHSPSTPAPASAAVQRDLEALAHEAHVPLDTVAQLYAREWASLAAHARITTFLPILTTRKVRAILRQQLACPMGRKSVGRRVIVEQGVSPAATIRESLAVLEHEDDIAVSEA